MKNKRVANFNFGSFHRGRGGERRNGTIITRLLAEKCYDFDGSYVMAARPSDKGTLESR